MGPYLSTYLSIRSVDHVRPDLADRCQLSRRCVQSDSALQHKHSVSIVCVLFKLTSSTSWCTLWHEFNPDRPVEFFDDKNSTQPTLMKKVILNCWNELFAVAPPSAHRAETTDNENKNLTILKNIKFDSIIPCPPTNMSRLMRGFGSGRVWAKAPHEPWQIYLCYQTCVAQTTPKDGHLRLREIHVAWKETQ